MQFEESLDDTQLKKIKIINNYKNILPKNNFKIKQILTKLEKIFN